MNKLQGENFRVSRKRCHFIRTNAIPQNAILYPNFSNMPHAPMKNSLYRQQTKEKRLQSCTLFINATGVCLHFRAVIPSEKPRKGLYHHKHGFLIDKLPIPPFLINKIFTHLIFTLPKYPSPIHPITPLFSRPIYHT